MKIPDYEAIGDWACANRNWLIFVFAVALLAFPAELFNFSLTIDEERTAVIADHSIWIAQGRWGQALMSMIFSSGPILPFTPVFLTLMLSAVSCTIIIRIWSEQRAAADYLLAPIIIACPTLYYVYQFNTLNYGVGFGMVCSALAVHQFVTNRGGYRLLAVPFACLAAGIYQAFVPCMIVLYGVYVLLRILKGDPRTPWQYILLTLGFGLMLVLSLALGMGISHLLYAIMDITPSPYLSIWMSAETNLPYLVSTLKLIKVELGKYYLGDQIIYGHNIATLKYLFILSSALSLITIAVAKQSIANRVFAVLVLLCVIASPFALHIMNGGFMPVRTMLAFPLALGGLVFVAAQLDAPKLKFLLGAVVVLVFFRFSVANNQMAFANQLSYQADREFSVRLLSRLDTLELSRKEGDKSRPLMLVGYQKHKETALMLQGQDYLDTLGASFYYWQGGSIKRVLGLLKIMGIDYFRAATAKEQRGVLEQAELMPIWPDQGSIAEIDGIIVIKLGNFNWVQLISFLDGKKACNFSHSAAAPCRTLADWHPSSHPRHDGISIRDIAAGDGVRTKLLVDIDNRGNEQQFGLDHAILMPAPDGQSGASIRGQGGKASITIPAQNISSKQRSELKLVINVPETSSMVLHYRYRNEKNYTDKHKAVYYLEKGENRLSLLIPGELLHHDIRLTPSAIEGEFTIRQLSLSQGLDL